MHSGGFVRQTLQRRLRSVLFDWRRALHHGASQPIASMLNDFQGQVVANAAIVPAGPGGSIDIFSNNPTDLSLMISGYFFR
jgi:hypothetical protein